MLQEIIEQSILKKRPEQIDIRTYGNYDGFKLEEATYDDQHRCYEINNIAGKSFKVRSAKAFISFIKEELKRRNNLVGKYATTHLTLDGGYFLADCNMNKGHCEYSRLNSEGYDFLDKIRNMEVGHEEFLNILRKLKPYINNFHELYKNCSKIKVLRNSKVTSQPTFNEGGGKDDSFTCTYQLENGEENDFTLPSSFHVDVPFVKAGEQEYGYDVELLYSLDNFGGLLIKMQIPNWETQEEQAILDEAEFIKSELAESTELLILADF